VTYVRHLRAYLSRVTTRGRGGYLITLPHGVLDRLKALRSPGESYNDVIIRVARSRGHSNL
jgi:hypothetical protein